MAAKAGNRPTRNGTTAAAGSSGSIVQELRSYAHAAAGDRRTEPWVLRRGDAILVAGAETTVRGLMVAAAVDDDHNPGPVLRYASAQAARLGVPLRAVHVWTEEFTPVAPGLRLRRHDRMCDADQLLMDVLYECLPAPDADAAERQILHDPDPVRALVALSQDAALLVVGVRGEATREGVGDTVRRLAGRTACPLAVLPEPEDAALLPTWR